MKVKKSRRKIWERFCTRMKQEKCVKIFFCGNPKENEHFGKLALRWDYDIKVNLKEMQ
jgi:hypothetical protein